MTRYDTLLTFITLISWYFTLRKLYAMHWEKTCDARNLAEHCSKYAIPERELTKTELENSGNVFIVSSAEYRGRRVILKRWHGSVVPHQTRILFTKRLIRDLDRWRALEHPNIAPVLGVALHISNLPALVVPLNRTVNQVLAANPETDVSYLMQGVASGLSYLHAQNPPIIHGDLKGSTVFVSSASGAALLTDIGVAAIPQPPDWGFHGVDDARWMAPELMDTTLRPESSAADSMGTPDATVPMTAESDVYSFGMLSYEMHTRARPFASTTWTASIVVHIVEGKRPPRPSAEQSPQLTDAVWQLIQLCWAQDYRKRPHIDAVVAWLGLLSRTLAVEGVCSDRGTLL